MPSDMFITIWKSLQECLPLPLILFFLLINWLFSNQFHEPGEDSETWTSSKEFLYKQLDRKDTPKLMGGNGGLLLGNLFVSDVRKFSPFSPSQSYRWKRQKESTAMLENSILIFWCSWCNFLKVKTTSEVVASKVQPQPGFWLQRRMRTHKNTLGLLNETYLD